MGGDMAHTFNVSTATGILAAAAGAKVAKHGNRSASSKSGRADVLAALGMRIHLTPEQVAHSIQQCGFGFMFAQAFHPAMKYVGPTRSEIGIRTVFNTLGPLTNPAHTRYQVLGVPDRSLLRKMGEVLLYMGSRRALIVHGADGLDELSLSAPSYVCEVDAHDGIREYTITPEELGLTRTSDVSAIRGGEPAQNASMLRDLFYSYSEHPVTQVVCLNTAAALLVSGLVSSLKDGVKLAQDTIRSGKGKETLLAAIECSQAS
jgi:anthranilate phosphoribosyltransferase